MNACRRPSRLSSLAVAALLLAGSTHLAGCDREGGVEMPGQQTAAARRMEAPDSPRSDSDGTDDGMEGSMPGMPGMGGMEGMGGGSSTVRVTPEQAGRMDLRWGEAEVRPLVRTVRTAAVIEYPESKMVWVSPKIGGWAEKLHVTFEGAVVRAGQPLLDLYSPDLVTAQEELLLAGRLEEDLRTARLNAPQDSLVAVARRRLRFWDISERQIERLLETGEVTKTMTLHAPATGIVMKKQVFEGQGIEPGDNLFMIAPTDPVWIEAAIYEQDLPFVREGLPVQVSVQGLSGRRFSGQVSYLYPHLEESTRTVVARIEVPNPTGELKPGMYATVGIESRTEPVLAVPTSAVFRTGTRDIVFMDMGAGRLMPMVVEAGRIGDDGVEVLAGLEPGTRIVTSPQFLIDSEANLMEAMQAMMTQMGRMEGMEMEGMPMEGMKGMEGMQEMDMQDAEGMKTDDRDEAVTDSASDDRR